MHAKKYLINDIAFEIASLNNKVTKNARSLRCNKKTGVVFRQDHIQRVTCESNRAWSELSYRMQALRDNPLCAKQEYENLLEENDPGMNLKLTYDPDQVFNISEARPRVAILREQGINGQQRWLRFFDMAGFTSVDVHMTTFGWGV
jgi:hypothetical protein